jgi:hypothetical protein
VAEIAADARTPCRLDLQELYSKQTTGAHGDSPAGVTAQYARSRLWKNTDVRLAYITKPTLCFTVRAFIRAPAEQSLGSLFSGSFFMVQATWPGSVRSWKICALWLIIALATLLSAVLLSNDGYRESAADYRILLGLVFLFSFQAFLAEAIGVRANAQSVSFPRRLLPHLGFPTLWRRRIALKDVSRADSFDDRSVRLYLFSTELVDILFPNIMSKRHFMRYISKELARSVRAFQLRKCA